MGKTLMIFAALTVASNLFALDSSYDTSRDGSTKIDRSMSIKKGQSRSNSNRTSDSSARGNSTSNELTLDTYQMYFPLAASCVREPKTALDFDLTTVAQNGMIDLTLGEYYDQVAKNNQPIKSADMDENRFKKYLGCMAYNGARMAQANIVLSRAAKAQSSMNYVGLEAAAKSAWKRSAKIDDPMILSSLKNVARSLESQCVFVGSSDKIKCGGLKYSFSDGQLQLGNGVVYGYNTMFGVTSQIRVSLSDSKTHSHDISSEIGSSMSRDIGITQDTSDSQTESSKQSVSVGKFLPSFQ